MTTGTVSAAFAIAKTNYTHEACADAILANPAITQNDLAAIFGYTPAWMSRVLNSDAFQEYIASRKNEIVDPILRTNVEAGFKALVNRSLDVLLEKLSLPAAAIDDSTALKALEISAKAMGYGARAANVAVNMVQNIAVVPAKSASSDAWMAEFTPKTIPAAAPLQIGED